MKLSSIPCPFRPIAAPTCGIRSLGRLLSRLCLCAGLLLCLSFEPGSRTLLAQTADLTPTETHALPTQSLKSNRPKVGVVLSGGGAKGIAHVGTLKIIEELGIPVDYIAGTSMGSIIGGLYAYGYSAAELDSILRAADWEMLLSDKAIRSDIYLTEKRTADQYVLSLPFSQHSSLLPIGILKGQHINNLFYSLTTNSYKVKSFNELNIPFLCIATDVLSGQAVVLDKGNLAEAMRASMAIPGVFNPVEKDSMILVDGGLVNNFPVEELIAMGADIVIGVDVGFQYKGKEKLKNMANVLEMSMFMHTKTKIAQNKSRCRVLVMPDMTGYGTYSFSATDSLLARGEAAARLHYDEFKAIAEELAAYEPATPARRYPHQPLDRFYISEIRFEGLSKFSPQFANQFLQIDHNTWVKQEDIVRGVERLYGSLVFDDVRYAYLPDTNNKDQVILNITVDEKPTNAFRLGFRYDNQRSAALLAGVLFRDLGVPNSRLSVDGELSRIPDVKADFLFTPKWKQDDDYAFWRPSIGASYQFYFINREYLYHNWSTPNTPTSEFSMQGHRISLYGQSNWRRSILGGGIRLNYHHFREKFASDPDFGQRNFFYIMPYLFFLHDSYDQLFFPRHGIKADIEVSYPIGLGISQPYSRRFLSARAHLDFAFSPVRWFSIYPGIALGTTLLRTTSKIPMPYMFYQGGLTGLRNGVQQADFAGLMPFQSEGQHFWNLHLNLQAEVLKNLYVSLRGYTGMSVYELKDLVHLDEFIYGGAAGLSYNTPIGPIGLHFQSSNVHPFNIWLSILYWL